VSNTNALFAPSLIQTSHWSVFTASIATVFVFWGITPTQAGIFAIDTLNKTIDLPMARSTSYLSLSEQKDTLSAQSAHSVSSIMWLNETLQPFMSRDYLLAPFGPSTTSSTNVASGNWTGNTYKYSVDVNCETPVPYNSSDGTTRVNSTWGCHFGLPAPRRGSNNTDLSKIFDTLYVGYWNDDGLADYYLSDGSCPKNQSNSFLIQWSKALVSTATFFELTGDEQRQHANVTTMWCRSNYYVQEVRATVRFPERMVLNALPLGPPSPLPVDLFNSSSFEAAMSMGHERDRVRTNFPTTDWPDQSSYLQKTPLNLDYLPKMTPFSIGATQLPLDRYLDAETFANSYQSAYRLLFARQLANVLSPNLDPAAKTMGQWSFQTQSVILVPAFTYIVEALLGLTALLATIILYYSHSRTNKLHSDPATISAVMSLVADDDLLLSSMRGLDQATEKEIETQIQKRKFQLTHVDDTMSTYGMKLLPDNVNEDLDLSDMQDRLAKRNATFSSSKLANDDIGDVVQGVHPGEFTLKIGFAFLFAQLGLFSLIVVLFVQIWKNNGLPLPSNNRFVRQLLENYLPTAIGTLIEPFWVVLNRNLCALQPFEALRKGRMGPQDSIGLDYASLPPQLVIGKALSRKNLLLAAVCFMTLLANVLAVSLSGLLFEDTVNHPVASLFKQPFDLKFQPLDGAAGAFVQAQGGTVESFYIATSNQTAHTELPPWTDSKNFYLPFTSESQAQNQSWTYKAITKSVGAQLNCNPLSAASSFAVTGTAFAKNGFAEILSSGNLTVVLSRNGNQVTCLPRETHQESRDDRPNFISDRPTGSCGYEFTYALDGVANGSTMDASFCREHIAVGWVRGNLINGTLLPGTNYTDFLPSVVTSYNSTIMICRGEIVTGTADATVDSNGHIMDSRVQRSVNATADMFSTTAGDVFGQANQFILNRGMIWHNDSFPSDFGNYLLGLSTNSSRLVDPQSPPPVFNEVVVPFSELYSKLFAIWISRNMDQLMEKKDSNVQGYIIQPTIRIFISKTMFIIAETILALYIIVTIILYLRRPWKILCRMPTSPASIIAFFAASNAVRDMRDTSRLTSRGRREYLDGLSDRYGFGTFIGTDSEVHVGIEKHPFLAPLTRYGTGLTRKDSGDSKSTDFGNWRSKVMRWKSGKAREGGWI
jgi:hypothetical protein